MQTIPIEATVDTVTSCLATDHQRLDTLLELTIAAVDHGDLQTARVRFQEFARHQRDHMRFEEEFMFPIVERTLCSAEGPVCVMRHDHQGIADRLCAISAALYVDDLDSFRAEHQALVETLENHNGREERVLYPAIDRVLDDAARARLVEDIRLHL